MNNIVLLISNIIYIYGQITSLIVCLFRDRVQQKHTCYSRDVRYNYKKFITGIVIPLFLFSILGESLAMNNGEDDRDRRHRPSRSRELGNTQQSSSPEHSGSEDGSSLGPDPDVLFAMFLSEHGREEFRNRPSRCPSHCCNHANCCFRISSCFLTSALAATGGTIGAAIGAWVIGLRELTPTASTIVPSSMVNLSSVELGSIVGGVGGCLCCCVVGGVCVYCGRNSNTLMEVEARLQRLASRPRPRSEGNYVNMERFGLQVVTTQPQAVGSSARGGSTNSNREGTSRDNQRGAQGERLFGDDDNYDNYDNIDTSGGATGGDDEPIYEEIGTFDGATGSSESDDDSIYASIWTYAVDLISGYNYGGQISSLLGMQCVLTGVSTQVPQTLRSLALKAYEKIPGMNSSFQPSSSKNSYLPFTNYKYALRSATENSIKKNQEKLPYHVFTVIDDYESNLECKIRSSQTGIVTELKSGVHIGLTYNRYNDGNKEYIGVQLDTGKGSVKAKAEAESIAAVVILNADKPGFTGHLVSSYGWGKIKTKRFFTHAGSETVSKGTPNITLTGGLIQIGYNLLLTKSFSITPYIEGVFSIARWEPYSEKTGLLLCKIGESNEHVIEKSLGLRSCWRISEASLLQMWIAGLSGHQTSSSLSLKPLLAPTKQYEVSVPFKKENYIKTEFGAYCSSNITNTLSFGVTTLFSFEKLYKVYSQQVGAYLHYMY